MEPMTKPTWDYNDPGSLATSGIYTNQDLEKLRDHIIFPAEKTEILNTVARGVMGEPTITRATERTAVFIFTYKKIWGIFLSFGNVTAGLIGIYFCARTAKLIINTIIHGYALHTIYGWSIHLVGALWDSVTNLLHASSARDGEGR
ncbi:uncharacterized protein LOC143905365 [Temnothorax americanus]|uniref:uncharacterized protein LOC143905365 n=1 Tax=Temnothorax americanus TaxID=1964332 RepID=UPI0040677E88